MGDRGDRRGGDMDRDRRDRLGGSKRPLDQERDDRRGPPGDRTLMHFRLLVALKKAGSVIGKGGDFIQMTKAMTGAKVGVDKAVGVFDERLVHIFGFDEPGKPMAGIQEALLRTAERILGDEASTGSIKLPHKCILRMLLFKHQIGAIMGKKGSAINEIRNKSGASVKLLSPTNGIPIVPCAEPEDELLSLAGSSEQVIVALKMISDKLRAAAVAGAGAGADRPPRIEMDSRDRSDRGDNKRVRGPERDGPPPAWETDRRGPPPAGEPPRGLEPPRVDPRIPVGPPPGGAIALALPPAARGVLANNDSVKTEGLVGLVTVEYRVLVPNRRASTIFGSRGGINGLLKDISSRTGAMIQLYEEDKGSSERILQVMSTEDVQEQRCAAFDAAMDCMGALMHDVPPGDNAAVARIILQQGQVGAVMGKAGSTIKELRNVSGCSIHLSNHPDVPRCVKRNEEVMELRGARDSVMLASHIAFVAIRGNMARGQLIYKHPVPAGAPPPTRVIMGGPPPGMAGLPMGDIRGGPPPAGPHPDLYGAPPGGFGGPPPAVAGPGSRAGPPPDPRVGGSSSSRGTRWDTDAPRPDAPRPVNAAPPGPAPAPAAPPPVAAPPPAAAPQSGPPPGAQVVYVDPNNPNAPQQQFTAPQQQVVQQAPAPQPQVQYVQGPPPLPGQPQVIYVQGPPPGVIQQPQVQYIDAATGQPIQYVQTAQQPGQVQVVQQNPPPAVAPASQPMVVYTSSTGQQVQYVTDPNQPQQPTQVTYVYAQPPAGIPQAAPAAAPAAPAAIPAPAPASTGSGPGSTSGYGGLAGLVGAVAAATGQAPPPAAAAPPAVAAAPAPVPAAPAPAPTPKARVLLTQDQVVRLRLDDPAQCKQLGALSGATITLSDHILENGAREVLLAGSDQQCNTAKNLMEALMRSG